MVSKFTVRKCKLNRIIKTDTDLLDKINLTVINYNYTVSLVYQFIKSYWLHQYHLNPDIQIQIDSSFINICFKLLSDTDNRGKKIKDSGLMKSVKSYYNDFFKETINPDNLKSLKKTRFVKQYQIVNMITDIENNIKNHFEKRLFRYLQSVFLNDNINSEDKKEVNRELNTLKRDLINNNCSQDKYQEWFSNNRDKLIPTNDFYKSINTKPIEFLKSMFLMNSHLEMKGKKTFNCLPLGNNSIPKYITLDTAGLIDLSTNKGVAKMLKDLEVNKIVWDNYFKMGNKIFKDSNPIKIDGKEYKYKFNGMIKTDGIGVSILMELLDKDKKPPKTNKKSKNDNEFPRFEKQKEDELEKIKKSKRVYIDPGKRNLICCIDDNNKRYIYKNNRRMFEMGRKRKLEIIEKEKEINKIKELENKLNDFNSKTSDHKEFLKFCSAKNQISNQLFSFYEKELFRNMKFRSYCLKRKSESKVVNEMKELYGKDAILMYGDKNNGPQMKHFISTPMVGFKRMINKHFKIYDVDEFRTSKLDHKTSDENLLLCKNAKDNNGNKIHGVLVSKILLKGSDGKHFLSYNNRDINGCKNIRKIVLHGLNNDLERPYWFRRSTKLTPEKK